MKKIFHFLKEYHKEYFDWKMYLVIFLFNAALIIFNYTYDFEDSYIDKFPRQLWQFILIFIYHSIAYYGVVAIIYRFRKDKIEISRGFIIKSLIGMTVLTFDRVLFPFLSVYIHELAPALTRRFYTYVIFNAYGWVSVVLFFAIIKYFMDRKEDFGIYGLKFKKVDYKMYAFLLAIVVPLIYAASWTPDFISYYPIYKRALGASFSQYYDMSESWTVAIYEFFYLTDFVSTELVFRGFFVIGLAKFLGKDVVLPIASCYAVLHFGKPLGEAISSIFGGYILGIIAFYTKNIWGGVFLHAGTAFFMELFAFFRQE